MPIDKPDREQLKMLAEADASVEIPASVLLHLLTSIEELESENGRLKTKLAGYQTNSSNSSKPPASDRHNPNKPDKKKPKGKRGRNNGKKKKPGAQKGHKGSTLAQVADPDHVENHKLNRNGKCGHCQGSLRGAQSTGVEKRQIFDLPKKITIEVTEHRAETGTCPCCNKKVKAPFPKEVAAPVQYGQRIRTMVVYLHTYQLLPCARLSEFFSDVFGSSLSPGTVCGMLKKAGSRAGPICEAIKAAICQAVFIHCDETGLSISGKLHWLHTASTPKLVYLHVDKKRGAEALRAIGILEKFTGWVIHDCLAAYYMINEGLKHVLCNAHILRELINVHENHGQEWAADMIKLLLEAKKLKDRELEGGRTIGPQTVERLHNRYVEILEDGIAQNPEPVRRPGQRGRLKRGKPLNLLNRLAERSDEVMAFLVNKEVPFDNNEAERDLRMMKVKQKISGCFRNIEHARAFAKVRSIIASAKKQAINVLEILTLIQTDPEKAQQKLLGT